MISIWWNMWCSQFVCVVWFVILCGSSVVFSSGVNSMVMIQLMVSEIVIIMNSEKVNLFVVELFRLMGMKFMMVISVLVSIGNVIEVQVQLVVVLCDLLIFSCEIMVLMVIIVLLISNFSVMISVFSEICCKVML